MDLILLRHAEKNLFDSGDPGLTARGHEQARGLIQKLQTQSKMGPLRLAASPRRRTQETLRPLAESLKVPLEILESLDERVSNESLSQFRARVKKMLDELENPQRTGTLIWCSHLDWIDEFRYLIDCEQDLNTSPYDHWAPGQYLLLHSGDLWTVGAFEGGLR